MIQAIAIRRGHLSGYAMPVKGLSLTLAPHIPDHGLHRVFEDDEPAGEMVRSCSGQDVSYEVNSWFSHRLHRMVRVFTNESGRRWARLGEPEWKTRLATAIGSAGPAMVAWDVGSEDRAEEKLRGLIDEHQWRAYRHTGQFWEKSTRSGVTYVFRRLRPTLAFSCRSREGVELENQAVRPLCALCLHPVAYYDGTWAGGMVPTDDVIAHLLLMRGDEHRFWRMANQHPVWAAFAGV